MDLLKDLVDVDGERLFPPLLLLLLVSGTDSLLGLSCLLDGFSRWLRWHFVIIFEWGRLCFEEDLNNDCCNSKNRRPYLYRRAVGF